MSTILWCSMHPHTVCSLLKVQILLWCLGSIFLFLSVTKYQEVLEDETDGKWHYICCHV